MWRVQRALIASFFLNLHDTSVLSNKHINIEETHFCMTWMLLVIVMTKKIKQNRAEIDCFLVYREQHVVIAKFENNFICSQHECGLKFWRANHVVVKLSNNHILVLFIVTCNHWITSSCFCFCYDSSFLCILNSK